MGTSQVELMWASERSVTGKESNVGMLVSNGETTLIKVLQIATGLVLYL